MRDERTLRVLREGEVELQGRMPWSSNGTFLVEVTCDREPTLAEATQGEREPTLAEATQDGKHVLLAVYKPGRGERPLWDFPRGLYRREAAAWELSELLGWGVVPETIVRDGPLGEGSVQRFVDADFEQHYFTLYEDEAHHASLRTMCAFDLLANNTDRKSGHCLLDGDGRVWGIDNGLCFHPVPKVRTVIWEFGGELVDEHLLVDVGRLRDADLAATPLALLLDDEELEGVHGRAESLLRRGRYPEADPSGRCYPWPLV